MVCFDIKDNIECRVKRKKTIGVFTGLCKKNIGFSSTNITTYTRKNTTTEMVGSQSAFIKISAIIEVVVVLPCVPATLIAVE